jgi:hypothetical protein
MAPDHTPAPSRALHPNKPWSHAVATRPSPNWRSNAQEINRIGREMGLLGYHSQSEEPFTEPPLEAAASSLACLRSLAEPRSVS